MPIYEYACTRCEKEFEELIVRSSDEAAVKVLPAAPRCGAPNPRPAFTRGGPSGGGAPPLRGPVG